MSVKTFVSWWRDNRRKLIKSKDTETAFIILTNEIDDFVADYGPMGN